MGEKLLEEDLYKPVADFLVSSGFEVRGEVNFCDIAALKDEELVIVELKKSLSVDLLTQAVKRQKFADLVYIAVPKPKKMMGWSKWTDICHLIRRLELGLIVVSFKGEKSFVEVVVDPVPFDREKSRKMNKKKRTSLLKEFNGRNGDLNKGGSKGKKLVTAYRENSLFIACCLQRFGELSPKRLKELGAEPKKTLSILSKNHYNWFKKVDRGVYSISEEGLDGLKVYEPLAVYYNEKIDEHLKNEIDKGAEKI